MSDDLFYGPSLESDSQPPAPVKVSAENTKQEDRELLRFVSKSNKRKKLYQTASIEKNHVHEKIKGNTIRHYSIVFYAEEGSIVVRQNFKDFGSQVIYIGDDLERAAAKSNDKIEDSRNKGWVAASGRVPGSFLYVSAGLIRLRLWEAAKEEDPDFRTFV